MDRPPTPAHRVFIREYVENGGHASAAYRIAYPKSKKWTDGAVKVEAFHLKQKLGGTALFRMMLERAGLDEASLSAKLLELVNAEETVFISSKDGVKVRKRPDNPVRVRAAKLAIEAHGLIVQKQEIKAAVGAPSTFTGWLAQEIAQSEAKPEEQSETEAGGDEPEE